jgi:uncharacterized membrane protein
MTSLIMGTSFFVGIHLFISGTKLRDTITDRIGEKPYLGLFSLASAGSIFWMCSGYASSPTVELWGFVPGTWTFAAVVTMPIAFFFAVVGITTPSPTAVGAEGLLDGDDPVRGILRITRHPFLWGVAIWAATHIVANGDVASVIFFGGFLALTLFGTRAIDGKRARKLGDKWQDFALATSNLPFAAIVTGRNRLVVSELLSWRLAAAAAAYTAIYIYHGSLFG